MLDYTRAALNKTVQDLKTVSFWFTIILQTCYVAYLVFASIVGRGMRVVNITLCVITFAYLIFYVSTAKRMSESAKSARKTTKRVYKSIKLTINAFSLVVALYSIFITNEVLTSVSLAGILVNVFLVIGWFVQTLLMVLSIYVEKKVTFILDGFHTDLERITKPFDKVGGFVKRIKGEPIEPKKYEVSPKNKEVLETLVQEMKEEIKAKRIKAKEEYKAQKKALKLEKKKKLPPPQPEDQKDA